MSNQSRQRWIVTFLTFDSDPCPRAHPRLAPENYTGGGSRSITPPHPPPSLIIWQGRCLDPDLEGGCEWTEEKAVRLRSHSASEVTTAVSVPRTAKLSQVFLSSFSSGIRKDGGRIQLSISLHLSQQHLWLAYLKQHMPNAPGISSEIRCTGNPAAGEALPSFLRPF